MIMKVAICIQDISNDLTMSWEHSLVHLYECIANNVSLDEFYDHYTWGQGDIKFLKRLTSLVIYSYKYAVWNVLLQ